jgi:Putative adhesin
MNPTVGFGRGRTEAQFERRLSVTGPVTLDVSARSGVVRVRRGEDGSVTIRGVLRAQASIFSWSHPEDQVQELAANPPVQQIGNTIQIGDVADRWLLRRVHLLVDITAPAETRIRALGDSADLRVEGIHGPVDCETDSGEIQIRSVKSEVSASSDSGAIHIGEVEGSIDTRTDSGQIEALQINGGIDAHTDSGNIRLSQSIAYPVYVHSDSGSISLKLAEDGGYTIRVCTDSGRIGIPEMAQTRYSGHEMGGVVRGGGSVVAIETDSGDIDIV